MRIVEIIINRIPTFNNRQDSYIKRLTECNNVPAIQISESA